MAVAEMMDVVNGQPQQNQQALALYNEAQQAMTQDDFDTARRKLKEAHQLDPQDMLILDAYGAFLAEAGPQQESVAALQLAVQQQPDKGFEKYMYLGQLLDAEDAISSIRKGVDVLQQQIATLDGDDKEEGNEQLAGALCALAERLLGNTDQLDTVAPECEQLLDRAQHIFPDSPEPLQVLASLRVEQQQPEEALQHLRTSMQKWFPSLQSMMAESDAHSRDSNEEDDVTDEADDEVTAPLPSFEFRFETAKLLIELDETTEAAVQILDSLIEEDDSVPNVWYMLAMCLLGGGQTEAAAEALQHGQKLLRKQSDTDDLAQDFCDLKVAIDEAAQERGQDQKVTPAAS
ncbi:hypothetical protein ABBQ38_005447 [Trebouxia sp. C0009 RCD-2024]